MQRMEIRDWEVSTATAAARARIGEKRWIVRGSAAVERDVPASEMPALNNESMPATSLAVFCASCHRLRISPGRYVRVSERYRSEQERTASHSICQPCAKRLYGMSDADYLRLTGGRRTAVRAA